jgi:hypothetical protein
MEVVGADDGKTALEGIVMVGFWFKILKKSTSYVTVSIFKVQKVNSHGK